MENQVPCRVCNWIMLVVAAILAAVAGAWVAAAAYGDLR